MFIVKITVTLRKSILDPQGKAVRHGAHTLGYQAINDIRIGKYIEMKIDAPMEAEARRIAEETCQKLLANPVMEDYRYTVEQSA